MKISKRSAIHNQKICKIFPSEAVYEGEVCY